ncbi:hypothetical protein Huta_0571 [Halorhabdus utahensis DSM 12940]|uniref:Uncharacterized protein n=1 Tax=Halorhabdus utahensis (strain DSM 12940 / JCM 11049 / AX-2) TaxID=519442 RepID=C7NSU7_HALUD|nr:hypothetical protein [Halorhabdus utahensis]ACV10758.1 hypothetical protein Huta_0571 [Halorhabdus utahensis DSM 12940]
MLAPTIVAGWRLFEIIAEHPHAEIDHRGRRDGESLVEDNGILRERALTFAVLPAITNDEPSRGGDITLVRRVFGRDRRQFE